MEYSFCSSLNKASIIFFVSFLNWNKRNQPSVSSSFAWDVWVSRESVIEYFFDIKPSDINKQN